MNAIASKGTRGKGQEARKPRPFFAWCWQSGRIGLGYKVPAGAIQIANGRRKHVRGIMNAWSRLWIHNEDIMIVPGVPEAPTLNAKVDAVITFSRRVEKKLKQKEAA